MAEATYKHSDGEVKGTAAGALASGEIVQLSDGRAGVVQGLSARATGDAVSYAVEGVFDVASASATTFSAGAPVYWDASANQAVAPAATLDGGADFYLGVAVKAKPNGQTTVAVALNVPPIQQAANGVIVSQAFEFDTETDTDVHTLIPAAANKRGLLILGVYGTVTEVFAGASQDQGIVTIKDTAGSPATLATLTPTDGGADASGDVIVGTGKVLGGTTGDAVKTVAAGLGVTGTVTQAVSGAGAAGKMRVYVLALPLV